MAGSTRPRWVVRSLCVIGVILLCALAIAAAIFREPLQGYVLPDRTELRRALSRADVAAMRPAYAARDFKPVWITGDSVDPAAVQLLNALESSDRDGLTPANYNTAQLRQKVLDAPYLSRRDRMRIEVILSATFARYVRDLHTPAPAADFAYTDPELQPKFRDPIANVGFLAASPSAQAALRQATQMNMFYVEMRTALRRYRRGEVKAPTTEASLLRNLDRLRGLPGALGDRFVLVDVAARRLWIYEGGVPVDSMKVVVGSPAHQTPQMAAVIRYAIFNPYWNVPPDLTRDIYAPRIRADLAALEHLRMDPWSSFTAEGVRLDPGQVDWDAVAQGRVNGWLRQRPGPDNSMGRVKFMLPNALGIYLHDTPRRDLFAQEGRDLSAGCVRVEDAARLSRWLYRGRSAGPEGPAPEQRVNLPEPVPVYLIYRTVAPEGDHLRSESDVYGRDSPRSASWLLAPV